MRPGPSAVRAFAAHPTPLLQRSLRGWISWPHREIPLLVKNVASSATQTVVTYGGRRRLSGTAGGGAGQGTFGKDIADLNAEIEGFVGDLGDPDFDTTAPSGKSTRVQW